MELPVWRLAFNQSLGGIEERLHQICKAKKAKIELAESQTG
jgi:hypothetical protein